MSPNEVSTKQIEEEIANWQPDEVPRNTHDSKDDQPVPQETVPRETEVSRGKCCSFNGVKMAQGYVFNNAARGPIVMSNIFLVSSLVYLANEEAGCLDENDESIEDCDGRVYGWSPAPLISNIPVISGILAAFFMPVFGAIMDYTRYRWHIGVGAAVFITLIQAVQIYTVSATWFPMALLQALAAVLYQVEVMSVYAYLPNMARLVGQSVITKFLSAFQMVQFSCQALFIVVVIGVGFALELDDVSTAHYSQGINAAWIIVAFSLSWRLLPHVPPSRELSEGSSLWVAGFVQVGRTATRIQRDFGRSLWWFLLGVVFAEAAVNAFTSLSVLYLSEHVGMSGLEIGIFFLTSLVASLPGSVLGAYVTSRVQPKNSYRLCLAILAAVAIVGALILKKDMKAAAFVWGMCVGLMIGWYYPTENLFFSLCLPKGQDAEFAGFFIYCTQILVWLPPLVFALLVQAGVSQKFGIMSVAVFMLIAVGFVSFLPSWDEVLYDAHKMDEPVEIMEMTHTAREDSTDPTFHGHERLRVALNRTGSSTDTEDDTENEYAC